MEFLVHLAKAIKYINLSIAVLLAFVVAAVFWYVWRPLAKTSGEIAAPISGAATIERDARGVPHINAANWEDAIFLQGYVTAQDRLWQMDALRRLAGGELAEVVGAAGLNSDREARALRMRRMAEAHWRTLPSADRVVLNAYARGVNYFIETHRGNLPLEFTLLGYDPRPWSPVDTVLAGLQMHRNLTTTWKDDLEKQLMLEHGDAALVNQLFPARSGREVQPGSNAWAVSGKWTASGKPILANDPHLDFDMPSTWYMVHLKAPGLNVSGVSLPGVPCVIIGHNDRIAWGVTNLGFDVQDLYQERLDPQSGRYVFQGKLEQARLETEPIAVKGAKPFSFSQWVTRHGPVIDAEEGRFLALRWAAAEPGSYQFPFFDLNRAQNWREFLAAIERFPGPGQNFVYADVEGNIGYHATGKLPIRKNFDGDLPLDGSSGEYEWEGWIPFAELPSAFNPERGYVVTANQNPFPADYNYRVGGVFSPPYRSTEIRDLLTARKGWKPEDMLVVAKDVYSPFLHLLAQRTVAAWDKEKTHKADLHEQVDLLRNWNGQMEKSLPAPVLARLLFQQVRSRLAEMASPGHGDIYSYEMSTWVVEKYGREELLLPALSKAYEEGRKLQGGLLKNWSYGAYNELEIKQPVGSQIPLIGSYFNIGPVPMSGSSTTIKQTTRRLGPSMRFVADLSSWDQSLNNITAGESGQFLSWHYKDQWDAYYAGQSFPMQFQKVAVKATLLVRALP
ncbi:MAG TPA: penicillin acylase family protein [Bryobacteraceae bacterium]|nr:penicillin acylase family protein [Bryobacteraceae bacterium]